MKSLRSCAGFLLILLFISPVYASPSPYTGLTITRIDLQDDQGNPWPEPERLLPLLSMNPGDRYSASAIREGLSALHLKSIFKSISAEAYPDAGGVRVVFVLAPITVVDAVVVHNNGEVLTTEIRDLLAPLEGRELREERFGALSIDIRSLFQSEGFQQASVSFHVERLPEPHRVRLRVDINAGEPTLIEEISFTGNQVFTEKELRKALLSATGSRLKRDVLLDADKDAVLKKYTDAGYPTAKPGPFDINFNGNRAFIHITINEGPHVTARFAGNREFSKDDLKPALLIWTEHDISDAVIDSSMERIKTMYRERGYSQVAMEVTKTIPPGGIDLEFIINEGPMISVEEIKILGNTAFPAKEITSQMALRASGWFISQPFREDLLDKDIDNLRDRYHETGYLQAIIKKNVVLSSDKRFAIVVIDITEGPRTTTGDVSVEGNLAFTSAELLDKVTLKSGDPFNERLIDEDRYRILSAYTNKGYLYARVDIEKTPVDNKVQVRYRISEDHAVSIGRIILRGNVLTKDPVIMRELLVNRGDSYDYGAILASQQRIYRLGYFRVARFEPLRQGEREYVKDMLFTVEERPAGAVEFGAGYGDLDRLRASIEVSHRNLWGEAKYSSLRFEQSDILKRAIFNYKEPWFLNRRLESNFSLVWSDSKRINSDTREVYYKTRKTVASFGVGKTHEKLKPSLTYQFENVRNYEVKPEAQLTTEDSGRVLISSLSPALVWDLRDDVFNPRSGMLYGIILKEALRELMSEADFSKLTVQSSWFIPISSNVLALSARAGMAWPFRETRELPIHERFYVGGSTTVRGYTQDSIGPSVLDANNSRIPQGGQSMAVLNVELRFNPGEGLGVELFVDAGNVWPDQTVKFEDLRSSCGIGLRYGTPIGPLRLDYGQKIDRKPGESPGEVHFSIGNTF